MLDSALVQSVPLSVIITAPSLDESSNVSGISSVARLLIGVMAERKEFEHIHLCVGTTDRDRTIMDSMRAMLNSTVKFVGILRKCNISLCHINTALNLKSIGRDTILSIISRIFGIPVLLHVHGGRYYTKNSNIILRIITVTSFALAKKIVVLSSQERTMIESLGFNRKIEVLANCVSPPEEIHKFGDYEITERLRFVFCGRLESEKGLDVILGVLEGDCELAAFCEIDVIGFGSRGSEFVDRLSAIEGLVVRFHGVLSQSESRKRLAQADILLLPSLYGEGLPMVLLEAMSAGVVPIVTALASIPTVVQNRVNGFLITSGSEEELKTAMRWCLKHRDELRLLGTAAMETVAERHSSSSYADQVKVLYYQVVGIDSLERVLES